MSEIKGQGGTFILDDEGVLLEFLEDDSYVSGKMIIPEGVTGITKDSKSRGAFQVFLPDSLRFIGDSTFEGCRPLEEVHFGNGLEHIGKRAFYGVEEMGEIILPDSVTSIGEYAFANMLFLEKLLLSNSLTHLPEGLCADCMCLHRLDIPYSVRTIGANSVPREVTIEQVRECELRHPLEMEGAIVTVRPRRSR